MGNGTGQGSGLGQSCLWPGPRIRQLYCVQCNGTGGALCPTSSPTDKVFWVFTVKEAGVMVRFQLGFAEKVPKEDLLNASEFEGQILNFSNVLIFQLPGTMQT